METVEKLERRSTHVHQVGIEAPAAKVWDFLLNIEHNYTRWHPSDHVLFKWTGGEPMAKGSTFYAEQMMMNNKVKYKGMITESLPGRKISMKFSFPLSLITEKIEMIIEDHGKYSTFKHITHLKFLFLSRTIFRKRNLRMLSDMDLHVKTEAENMKQLLDEH